MFVDDARGAEVEVGAELVGAAERVEDALAFGGGEAGEVGDVEVALGAVAHGGQAVEIRARQRADE